MLCGIYHFIIYLHFKIIIKKRNALAARTHVYIISSFVITLKIYFCLMKTWRERNTASKKKRTCIYFIFLQNIANGSNWVHVCFIYFIYISRPKKSLYLESPSLAFCLFIYLKNYSIFKQRNSKPKRFLSLNNMLISLKECLELYKKLHLSILFNYNPWKLWSDKEKFNKGNKK